ncbi:Thioredoxin-like protein SkfH [Planctomycetes bacterium Pan216]|uniref:Thioredoxin-like protein SkfH n=1 Tax=Kolteria novifilia TaxID=2527975 RepID=A0A518AWX6_9BACT|nr:Thioredoxin-like protein SkfH [Planctomycetes bacterium Pan216]
MRRLWGSLVAVTLFTTGFAAHAEGLSVGQVAPAWSKLEGTDGQTHGSADFANDQGLLIVFFSIACPDCELYLDRIRETAASLKKQGIATVLVNVSVENGESLDKMKAFGKEHDLSMPYVKDPAQRLGKSFGATVTPEFFLLDKAGRLVYRGALDDHWKASKVKKPYVRQAARQMLAGEPIAVPSTDPFGCTIDYED